MSFLNETELTELKEALHFMNMEELKKVCQILKLSFQGQKIDKIDRILAFLKTGTVSKPSPLPPISQAQKNVTYPLVPETLILSGSYKNDPITRGFMKGLVGDHFHFIAFGQEWIKQRWRQGKPPTYSEFAIFWQGEYVARQNKKASPKKEWAYLNFVQKYCQEHQTFTRQQLIESWEKHRTAQVKKAKSILKVTF